MSKGEIIVFVSVVCFFFGVFGLGAWSEYQEEKHIIQMVEAGANPLEARCALKP